MHHDNDDNKCEACEDIEQEIQELVKAAVENPAVMELMLQKWAEGQEEGLKILQRDFPNGVPKHLSLSLDSWNGFAKVDDY